MPAHLALRPLLAPLLLALAAACDSGGGSPRDEPPPEPPPPEAEVPRAPVELLVQRASRAGEVTWYTMAPDGSRVLPFTGIPADAVAAVPSPDGRNLALLRATGDDVHLWRMGRALEPGRRLGDRGVTPGWDLSGDTRALSMGTHVLRHHDELRPPVLAAQREDPLNARVVVPAPAGLVTGSLGDLLGAF